MGNIIQGIKNVLLNRNTVTILAVIALSLIHIYEFENNTPKKIKDVILKNLELVETNLKYIKDLVNLQMHLFQYI